MKMTHGLGDKEDGSVPLKSFRGAKQAILEMIQKAELG
jgi:hypothetical protein